MNYSDKPASYYSNVRKDVLALISPESKNLKVLEIGAAYGATLYFLKEKGIASEIIGIDIFEDKKNVDKYKPTDKFIFCDIEEVDFPEFEEYFDLILLPDVLEHMIDPKSVLAKVNRYLKRDGRIIVSMPNIRHYSALYKIFFKGDFRYEESGIFDYTHMRFYCRKNIKELLEKAGFTTISHYGSIRHFKGKSFARLINLLTFNLFEEFLSTQYFFKSKKA